MRTLWEDDFVPTSAEVVANLSETNGPPRMPAWNEILAALPEVLSDIDVRMINGSAKDALDYAERGATGLKVIAIGGDKLARGLTLEGLSTSYFVRTTKMYDTLMQMGRWFGYRPGYLDLCRLYTTSDLVDWFGHIADASEELREEFDAMVASRATPRDYGLRVASHPVLLVTSPLKMRTAQTLSLSYSGSFVQTIVFRNNAEALRQNLLATDRLLASMGDQFGAAPAQARGEDKDEWKRSFRWRGVGSDVVLEFLRSYAAPASVPRANSLVLADFIGKMNERGELRQWTVALLAEGSSGDPHTFANGMAVSSFPSRSGKGANDQYTIGVLTEPKDEGIDTAYPEWKRALELTLAEWQPDVARNRTTPPTRPSGKKLREVKALVEGAAAPGLLLVYPLSPAGAKGFVPEGWNTPVIGFAVSFPSSDSGVVVEYKVDHLYWEQEYGASE